MKNISMDKHGRVVIEDNELLDGLAGGLASMSTQFSTNGSCTNQDCSGTNSRICTNNGNCNATNQTMCHDQKEK